MDTGYMALGPLNMYYEMHGKHEGTPLLLLHGGGSGIDATFGRILPMLAENHWVIGVEQQGHGRTADIDRPFSLEQMADDTAALLDKLGIDSANVLGFSNGGQVAMYLTLKHPDKVKKLLIASSFYKSEGVIPELRKAWATPATVDDMPPGLVAEYQRIAPNPEDLQKHMDKSQQMMQGFTTLPVEGLKGIHAPTLILSGDRDVVLLEHTVEMTHLIPESRLAILPGAHGAYIGEASTPPAKSNLPRITVEIINEFIAGLNV